MAIVAVLILVPYTVIGEIFGFVSPQLVYLIIIGGIVLAYMVMAEIVKKKFYSKHKY